MAKKETINDGDIIQEILNVGATVGKHKFNLRDDVMLVQALLKYYREEPGFEFAPHLSPLGQPSGIPESFLGDVIKAYQQHRNDYSRNSGGSDSLKVDGVVSKARGKSSWSTGKLWTIVDLNHIAQFIYHTKKERGYAIGGDYVTDLVTTFPQLASVVGPGYVIHF